ncbi:MAG: hypothetical protein AAF663_03745 [Planctomycetota bacterium]
MAAFGNEQRAEFYIEVLPPQGDVPRPDLILVHPDLGCIVIENKGLALKDIVRVDGQQLEVLRNGRSKLEDPFAQSEKVVWRLRDQLTRRVQRTMMFVNTAAMPAVTRSDFERAFDTQWPAHTLFAEDLASPDTFAAKLRSIAESTRKRAGKRKVWSPLAAKELRRIINGTSFLFPPRLDHLDDDQGLLGDQIQKLENMDKNPTRLQRDIGTRDLRGARVPRRRRQRQVAHARAQRRPHAHGAGERRGGARLLLQQNARTVPAAEHRGSPRAVGVRLPRSRVVRGHALRTTHEAVG